MTIYLPDWFQRLSTRREKDRLARNKFLIRQAALLYSTDGKLETLAEALNIAYPSLVRLYGQHGGVISPDMAIRLEQAVGKDAMPRQLFRPDYFG
jgi:hypothetical protein